MNRGSSGLRPARGLERLASMRPRFMNRGSDRAAGSPRRGSRRFNEAPIHESGKWGSGAVAAADRRSASMRPRFMNRGSTSNGSPTGSSGLTLQ